MGPAVQTLYAIIGAILCALATAPAVAAPAGGDTAFARSASAAVERIEREDGFSGVILVARGDQVLLRKAAGFADRERKIPYVTRTKSPLESVTKQFTAAAIMLLLQDGKLSLDDLISKYYPASPPGWKDVTIKHLLTHSSGVGDINGNNALHFGSYEDAIRLVMGDPLVFAPGTRFQYSNTGYALLTAVIERASGQSFADFMRSRIFLPLGMRDTGYGSMGSDAVRGYLRSVDGEWHAGRPLDLQVAGGFGGLYSTLDDMLVWSRALETNKILSAASRTAMFTDYGHNYGFGWRFSTKFGRKLIWHTGNDQNGGFAAIFDRFPEEQLTVVVMTNNTGPTGSLATLQIEGKETTFPANAARKLVEDVERLYFDRDP